MSDINEILKSPDWTMDDAYVDLRAPRYEESVTKLTSLVKDFEQYQKVDASNVLAAMKVYEEAECIGSSLLSFIKCMGAKNSSDERVSEENSRILCIKAEMQKLVTPLFAFIGTLADEDPLWSEVPLSNWKFEFSQRKQHWKHKLSAEDQQWVNEFERMMFIPLGDIFKTLQKGVDIPAKNSKGEDERVRASKMVSVMKGNPDPVLRKTTFEGMAKSYGERGALYAALLNETHGYRLTAFGRAGVTPLDVSLLQNRMSKEALMAMREAILSNINTIREAVTLRTPYFGNDIMAVYDLMCPPPMGNKVPDLIPYEEGIKTVRAALTDIGPELGDFIALVVKNRWVDAVQSDNKIGGAFYSRFNEFKIPRVYTSYMGNITTILQQGHEMGHAFHYWVMRDLPTIQTEFPMTLTEMASTFNEAAIRKYLIETAKEGDQLHFDMLWQELRYLANFMLNVMVRFDFELKYFEERQKGTVNANRCVELMRESWKQWYGDTTDGADDYLWAYKLHYYKTDQHIYNYPYAVGYLLSSRLIAEKKKRGDDFMDFYKALLRDTGRMTVDDLFAKHLEEDVKSVEFWQGCLSAPLDCVAQFKAKYARK